MRRAHTAGPLGEHHATTRRRSGGACTGLHRAVRRVECARGLRTTAGGGSSVSTKSRGRRRPMTRQLASRQVEGEAAIDRPASLVHAVARCRSGGSAPGFCQRLCQTLWQNQAGTPGPTGAGLASGRISAGGVCSPMVGVAARLEPGRASACARFRAAPSAACTSHPVELLAQVVCCLICHVMRRHWARSPVQRAVSRLGSFRPIVAAGSARSVKGPLGAPFHLGRSGPPGGLLQADVAPGHRAPEAPRSGRSCRSTPPACRMPRGAPGACPRRRFGSPHLQLTVWKARARPHQRPPARPRCRGCADCRRCSQPRGTAEPQALAGQWGESRDSGPVGVSDCVSLSVLRPTIHTEPPGGDALVSVIRNTQNALVLARPPRPA